MKILNRVLTLERVTALEEAVVIYNRVQKQRNPEAAEITVEEYLCDLIDRQLDGLGKAVVADKELEAEQERRITEARTRLGLR